MLLALEHSHADNCSFVNAESGKFCEQIPELYLRTMVDSYSAAVAVLDQSGDILYVNRGWRDFLVQHGFAGNFYGVGSNYLDVRRQDRDVSAEECARMVDGIDAVLSGKQSEFQEEYVNRKSIDRRWIRIHAARFDLPQATRVLVTHEDVTDSHETGETRRKEAERIQFLLNVTHILPWEADFETSRFTFVGEQAVPMLGYPIEEWYEPGFWPRHLHPDDRERAMTHCVTCANNSDNYELEYRLIAKDGRVVWLHSLVTVLHENGHPLTIRGFSIDITGSKQTEAALRDLGGRLINAQEEERRRIARELHDDLNQRMALLSIELEQLGQKIKKPYAVHHRLENLQRQAQEISTDIHRLSYRLHPSKLDHLGLAPAVRSLCQEISGTGHLEVELQESGLPANLSKDMTLCVFRIVQEALRNCVKHSGASLAKVALEGSETEIRLSISDNGCGFDSESNTTQRGLGFTSMRERLRIVDGKIEIHSQPTCGTVIEASVPLTRELRMGH
ncbi:MAG TPA: PAS domain-containing protein [Pyrinomonadaceae bacterium]|nr:PAS domain-containing protein [Pyrinomonadaceae bacterium]